MRRMNGVLSLAILVQCAVTQGAEKRAVTVELSVPDTAWSIAIEEVYEVKNEIWVIARVSRDPNAIGAQVIWIVRDTVEVVCPDLPIKHFVIGKTWGWENKEPYTFLKDTKQIEGELRSGKLLYRRGTASEVKR